MSNKPDDSKTTARSPEGSRIRMRGKHPNPDGVIECYEGPGSAARAFIKLDVPAVGGLSGYWCERYSYEVVS